MKIFIYILSGKLYCGECGHLMAAETETSSTGVVHRYYKCFGKKKRANNCAKHNVKKDEIENFVFEKTKEYVLQPKTIESIATVVVDKFNSKLATNYVLIKLQEELKEKTRAINSMLDAIEKGVYTRSTQERLLKIEQEQAELEDKIAYEESRQLKPLETSKIVEFLKIYAKQKFESKRDRNDLFNNFISRVNLFNDWITIVYNTSLNPATEIYNRPENDPDDDPNDGGTIIYKQDIEMSKNDIKKLPFDFSFKRQLSVFMYLKINIVTTLVSKCSYSHHIQF